MKIVKCLIVHLSIACLHIYAALPLPRQQSPPPPSPRTASTTTSSPPPASPPARTCTCSARGWSPSGRCELPAAPFHAFFHACFHPLLRALCLSPGSDLHLSREGVEPKWEAQVACLPASFHRSSVLAARGPSSPALAPPPPRMRARTHAHRHALNTKLPLPFRTRAASTAASGPAWSQSQRARSWTACGSTW